MNTIVRYETHYQNRRGVLVVAPHDVSACKATIKRCFGTDRLAITVDEGATHEAATWRAGEPIGGAARLLKTALVESLI